MKDLNGMLIFNSMSAAIEFKGIVCMFEWVFKCIADWSVLILKLAIDFIMGDVQGVRKLFFTP